MVKRLFGLLALLIVCVLSMAACVSTATPAGQKQPSATPKPTKAPEPTKAPDTNKEEAVVEETAVAARRYGQVIALQEDEAKNQIAWKGMQQAKDELGVEIQLLESRQQADYQKNISELVNLDYDGIVTVGSSLAEAAKTAAEANPDIPFVTVDVVSQADNILGLQFAVDQASFLAGYLAAEMSETGIVCTYLAFKVPAVVQYVVGFESGVNYYNERKGTDVTLLGWKTYPTIEGGGDGAIANGFENNDTGHRLAENFFNEGCDVIFPVAGHSGLGPVVAAQNGRMIIGINTDHFVSNPDFGDVYLTSVLENIDLVVFESIQSIEQGTFKGGSNYLGTLENKGVGLAPFHHFDNDISQELRNELAAIEAGIINGSITTGWPIVIEQTGDNSQE